MSNEDNNQVPDIPKEIDYLTRQKVVRQLHDGLTQTVSALAMRINFTRRIMATDPEAASAELEKVEDLTREATKEIRRLEQEDNSHVPIIAMTAHAMKGDREACLAVGMDEYVSKPVSQEALRKAILALVPDETENNQFLSI